MSIHMFSFLSRAHLPLSICLPIAHLGGPLDLRHRLRHLLVERLGQHEREEAGGDGENAEDDHWDGRVDVALSGSISCFSIYSAHPKSSDAKLFDSWCISYQ